MLNSLCLIETTLTGALSLFGPFLKAKNPSSYSTFQIPPQQLCPCPLKLKGL